MEETRKQLCRLEVIGAVLTIGVLGFWFEFGAALGSKMGPLQGAWDPVGPPWLTI